MTRSHPLTVQNARKPRQYVRHSFTCDWHRALSNPETRTTARARRCYDSISPCASILAIWSEGWRSKPHMLFG